MRQLTLLALAFAFVLTSCGDDVQFAAPPKRTDRPQTGMGAMPSGHPPMNGGTASRGADPHGGGANPHGGAADAAAAGGTVAIDPHGAAPADPFAEEGGGAKVETQQNDPNGVAVAGEVVLGDGVKPPAGPFTLFVSIVEGPQGRMPVLTKRFDSPTFPAKFDLRYGDNPTKQVVNASQKYYLRASISTTGDVMKATNKTNSADPIKVGQTDAKLVLKP